MGKHNFNGKLAVITCTRDRAYALSLAKKYMERQTTKPDLWIIASEGRQPEVHTDLPMINIHDGVPKKAGTASFCRNMIRGMYAAIENNIDGALIMEDDDWYREDYIEFASKLLNSGQVTGVWPVQYVHLINGDNRWSKSLPLSQMGFQKGAFQTVIDLAAQNIPLIDAELYKLKKSVCSLYYAQKPDIEPLRILSIKGMYGEHRVTSYHLPNSTLGNTSTMNRTDPYEFLIKHIGKEDAKAYENIISDGPLTTNGPTNCVLFNATGDGKHYGCDVVMNNLYEIMAEAGAYVTDCYRSGFIDKYSVEDIRNLIRGARLVVVNGEGSIHHDNKILKARSLALVGIAAKTEGIPSMLINSTLCQLTDATLRNLTEFDFITTRENSSKELLEKAGGKCEVVPDLSFYKSMSPQVSPFRGTVRVIDSVLKDVSVALEKFALSNGYDYRSIMHPERASLTRDYVRTHAKYGFVVTGRYHDVCFCINANIPFVAIESNTNKISSLLMDVFGEKRRLISVSDLPTLEIDKYDDFTEVEKKAIAFYKAMAVNKFQVLKDKIISLYGTMGKQ